MIEHVHKHITAELQQNAKTDIIFILASIALNLITLAINASSAEKSRTDETTLTVMFIFVGLVILINIVAIVGLLKGKQTRIKLLHGLIELADQNASAIRRPIKRSHVSRMFGKWKVDAFASAQIPDNWPKCARSIGLC